MKYQLLKVEDRKETKWWKPPPVQNHSEQSLKQSLCTQPYRTIRDKQKAHKFLMLDINTYVSNLWAHVHYFCKYKDDKSNLPTGHFSPSLYLANFQKLIHFSNHSAICTQCRK